MAHFGVPFFVHFVFLVDIAPSLRSDLWLLNLRVFRRAFVVANLRAFVVAHPARQLQL